MLNVDILSGEKDRTRNKVNNREKKGKSVNRYVEDYSVIDLETTGRLHRRIGKDVRRQHQAPNIFVRDERAHDILTEFIWTSAILQRRGTVYAHRTV